MAQLQEINLDRIRWCCDDRGISDHQLRDATGINESTFQKFVEGKAGLTFNQLQKVARFFNRGVLFFLEPGMVDERRVHTPQFRTIANQMPEIPPEVKAIVERAENHRDIYLNLCDYLDVEDVMRFEPPRLNSRSPAEAAGVIRDWLGLQEDNDFHTYRSAVEARGILVLRSQGYSGRWQFPKTSSIVGFSLYFDECPVIVVRKRKHESQQAFTLMHELGHLLLHRGSFIDEEDDLYSYQGREREANEFAGHLLVPEGWLNRINHKDQPASVMDFPDWLRSQTNNWGISTEMLLRRLMDSGRVSKSKYDAYRRWVANLPDVDKEGGSRKYRYREPSHVFGETYVRTVLHAMHSNHITRNKASTFLDNLRIADLHKLENHLADL